MSNGTATMESRDDFCARMLRECQAYQAKRLEEQKQLEQEEQAQENFKEKAMQLIGDSEAQIARFDTVKADIKGNVTKAAAQAAMEMGNLKPAQIQKIMQQMQKNAYDSAVKKGQNSQGIAAAAQPKSAAAAKPQSAAAAAASLYANKLAQRQKKQ